MDREVEIRRGETETHLRLKRLALVWAQANGYSVAALEVTLPRCRFRADVAAYRPDGRAPECTAIFECKQALSDFRRDNCASVSVRARLASLTSRRAILERQLRVHYPTLRAGDTLFPEFDTYGFDSIEHRGYTRLLREMNALLRQLHSGTKFEKLVRYRCADVCYLVASAELLRTDEAPIGWGILVEQDSRLSLLRKPTVAPAAPEWRRRFLERVAAAGTRQLNRKLGITFEEIDEASRTAEL